MTLVVKSPGSCGELVQGMIDGVNFLITCPVNLYSQVRLQPGRRDLAQLPPKSMAAYTSTLKFLGISSTGIGLSIISDIPVGKGMASSSADISAVCQAAALSAGFKLTTDEIANIALAIEPTDGTFYQGIVMFDHVNGSIRSYLGEPPPIEIAVFDVGGEIDTMAFNRRSDLTSLNAAKEQDILQAVELVKRGLAAGDPYLVGQGATLSALAHQAILFKPYLEQIIDLADSFGAVGVNAAHSGTVIGVLFPADKPHDMTGCIAAIKSACPGIRFVANLAMISGGLVIEEEKAYEHSSL